MSTSNSLLGVMRAEAMCWLRFARELPAICSGVKITTHREWAPWSPAVLGCDEKLATQIEVFCDMSSLRDDLLGRGALFSTYVSAQRSGDLTISRRMPNYVYYMVSSDIAVQASEEIRTLFPQAGVLVFRPEMDVQPGRNVEIVRGASLLHEAEPGPHLMLEVMARACTELCDVKTSLAKLYEEIDAALGPQERKKRGPNKKKPKQIVLDIF